MMEVKWREQHRAKKLRAQGQSIGEIASKLNVSKGSVSIWVCKIQLSKKAQERLAKLKFEGGVKGRQKIHVHWREYRKNYPKPPPNLKLRMNRIRINEFFCRWTPEMAYVLGYFAADGCMYHSRNGGHSTGGDYIAFTSVDQELIQSIRHLMGVSNVIEVEYRTAPQRNRFILRLVNKAAFNRLLNLGFSPAKSMTMTFPDIPERFLNHFLRGYFDGDGCVYFARLKRNDSGQIRSVLQIRFTCGSYRFLRSLQLALAKAAHIGLGSLHPHGTYWELSYGARDARQLYYFMYPSTTVPCLERKREIFEKALKILGPVV